MTLTRNVTRCFARLTLIASMSLGLAGCYDIDTTLTLKADGTSALSGRLDFPRDAKHIAEFYQALMELQPGLTQFVDEGLCAGIGKAAAMNPHGALDLKAREYTTTDRFGCGLLYEAGDTDALIDKLNSVPGGASSILKIEKIAPRRVRFQLDFSNVPDLKHMLPGLLMLGAMKYGKPDQGGPSMEAINKVVKLYVDASLAMARMAAPNNHLQFAIKATNVIDTNGERDGDLVKFRWSWEELVRLLLKPDEGAQQTKVYYAIMAY